MVWEFPGLRTPTGAVKKDYSPTALGNGGWEVKIFLGWEQEGVMPLKDIRSCYLWPGCPPFEGHSEKQKSQGKMIS